MSATRCAADHDGRRITVSADDGVPLAVRELGPADAPLTVVFVHGHCQRSESWSYLRGHLRRAWGSDEVRIVFYDHRGHGESGAGQRESYTIDQLGHDLHAVLRAVAPTGPVVLVGHSMGAMTALTYARQHPETISSRIIGIGLIATAASGLTEMGVGRLLRKPAVSMVQGAVRWAPSVLALSKRLSRNMCEQIVRDMAFGRHKVSARTVALAAAMLNETSIVTMSSFLSSFVTFDESETLRTLADLPTLVLAGSDDLMTPFAHSAAIAARLPGAELVCIDGAGHSVILERAVDVAAAVVQLVERAVDASRAQDPVLAVAG